MAGLDRAGSGLMADEEVIVCEEVWKSYRIYHQRSHTLKEKVLARRNRFDEFWALRGVDLRVSRGSTLGIIGSNGSGKSTLLKTMARILSPNRGRVQVVGRMSPLLELGTGFHPELTGRENVYLGSSLLGQSRRQVDARYDSIVDFAGVSEFMDTPVKNYSSGMYARLAFAVAISVDPEILLVDEVLSVGDEGFQVRCHQRMADLRDQGATVVVVSHSLATVRSLCTEAVWLEAGTIRRRGPAAEVVAGYLDDVHAGLLGTDVGPDTPGVADGGHRLTGDARISGVSMLDGQGRAVESVRTGEAVNLRIRAFAPGPIGDVACGIAIYRCDDGVCVFGQNTTEAGYDFRLAGESEIDFAIDHLPLRAGAHVITVALHDRAVSAIYDWHERRYPLLVRAEGSRVAGAGAAFIDGRWEARPLTRAESA
ncbi:MAG: ABC transporter ATP-binding protein [Acidimicrobiales bacterium]